MEVLTLNGKKYVKASKAARDLGYASDYVGQLCRSGTVDAHLVGRTWYVNPDTLGAHRVEKKRNARVKAREHAKRSIAEAKTLKVSDETKSYKNIDIRYEDDAHELIPAVRKVRIQSHQERVVHEKETEGPLYTTENTNEKVMLSGTLNVQDAELEEEFTDTTVLTPRIIKKTSIRRAKPEPVALEDTTDEPLEAQAKPLSFEDRLRASEGTKVDATPIEESIEPEVVAQEISSSPVKVFSVWTFLIVLTILILGVGSIFISEELIYKNGVVSTQYGIDTGTVIDFINKNKDISAGLDAMKR